MIKCKSDSLNLQLQKNNYAVNLKKIVNQLQSMQKFCHD